MVQVERKWMMTKETTKTTKEVKLGTVTTPRILMYGGILGIRAMVKEKNIEASTTAIVILKYIHEIIL